MKPNIGQGDNGRCQLFGIGKVSKNHATVDLYGDLDELNSHVGHLRAFSDIALNFDRKLEEVQQDLFIIGSHVSTGAKQPPIHASRVAWLEDWLKFMEMQLPELTTFILPSGTGPSSYTHICRAVTRRVERKFVAFCESESQTPCDTTDCLAYINRLSDVFFAMARYVNMLENKEETVWVGTTTWERHTV